MDLDFWIDPACPWCWITSRWVVDIAPHRDVNVRWRPISLLFKNDTKPESPWYNGVRATLGMLRVMESVRDAGQEDAIGELYRIWGEQIHHQKVPATDVDLAAGLMAAGVAVDHAGAADDDRWDAGIRAHMDEGLGLTGNDVGTPILGFTNRKGKRVGWFGPVISRRLPVDDALALWDGVMLTATIDSFFELKRTRTEAPDFTPPDAAAHG